MADTWYVRTNESGGVIHAFCDDVETPKPGDILLSPSWYYGRAPGVIISRMYHAIEYTVEDGRLHYTYDNTENMEILREKRKTEIDNYEVSPNISLTKLARLPAAKQEAYDHIDACINEAEISQTLLIGY